MPNTLDTAVKIESTRSRPPVGADQPDAWTVYDALGNRVATKINDVWQLMVYDAFGKLVAEYGVPAEGSGGVNYIQQDWQGSVRAVANSNGHVVARTDHQAFGEEIGVGVGLRKIEHGYSADRATRQGYGLTENDESSGLNHTWFRKLENQAGRWTSPDPYNGSMSVGNPQSFNRYSYVENQPTNFVDPSGLFLEVVCLPNHWDPSTATLTAGACFVIFSGVGLGSGGMPQPVGTIPFENPPVGGGGGGGGVPSNGGGTSQLVSTDPNDQWRKCMYQKEIEARREALREQQKNAREAVQSFFSEYDLVDQTVNAAVCIGAAVIAAKSKGKVGATQALTACGIVVSRQLLTRILWAGAKNFYIDYNLQSRIREKQKECNYLRG